VQSVHGYRERERRELVARWYRFHADMSELHARLSQEHAAKAERLCEDPPYPRTRTALRWPYQKRRAPEHFVTASKKLRAPEKVEQSWCLSRAENAPIKREERE